VASRPSRPLAPKDDLDLTRPEELQARRRKRLLLLALPVVAVLAVGIYFAASPVSGAIKGWQSRRLAHQAFALIEQKQWNEADAKARDAFLLRPTEPEAWRAIARLYSRIGKNAPALEWWKKVDEQHRLTVEDRRDFAKAALVAGELTTAATQIDQLLAQKGGPQPVDILLAGQLAVRRNDALLAVDYAQRTLADKRTKPYDILSAAILVLSVTTHASPPYISAWKRIEDLARDPQNAASLDALTFLATQQSLAPSGEVDTSFSLERNVAAGQQPAGRGQPSSNDTSLSLGPTNATAQPAATMGLLEIADALEKHPNAGPSHKLLALQLRVQHDPALTDQYVADAVERFGKGDDETLAALAAWLNSLGRAHKTLELLPLDRAVRSQALYLQHINALAALGRWDEVKEILMSERFPIDLVLQHMYLATARSHLGETTGTTNEWQRALESAANNADKLMTLATYAEQNHASDIADAAYAEIIKGTPRNRTAYAGRLRLAEKAGRTADAQKLAAEIVKLWPDAAAARNEDAYLRLLLGASDGAAEAAEREAQVLVAQEPLNWAARATLGLARLRLGKKQEALAVFRNIRATGSEPPGALAVRAAILAVTGYEEGARGDARNLGAEHLLPEERALIAPLLSNQSQ
jgi:Tfp pilus assembly protein PilF